MYMWPVLWMAHFYGRRGTVFIVAWVGVVHGVALIAMPPGVGTSTAGSTSSRRWRSSARWSARCPSGSTASSRRSSPRPAPTRSPGLLNRRGLEERLVAEAARAARDDLSLAVVAFDLDHFKRVNDEQGHEAGDRALAMVGAVIADHVRGADAAARWGGEEFVVALPRAGARRRVRLRRARPRRGRGIVGRGG